MKTNSERPDAEQTRAQVRESYGRIAVSEKSCCSATPNCCGSAPDAAEANHVAESKKLGVTKEIANAAIAMAAKVEDAPPQNIMRLAERLTAETATNIVEPRSDNGESCCGGIGRCG